MFLQSKIYTLFSYPLAENIVFHPRITLKIKKNANTLTIVLNFVFALLLEGHSKFFNKKHVNKCQTPLSTISSLRNPTPQQLAER